MSLESLQFSTSTTGKPRCVPLRQMMMNIRQMRKHETGRVFRFEQTGTAEDPVVPMFLK